MKKCPNREYNNAHLFKEIEPYITGKTGRIYILRKGPPIGHMYVEGKIEHI